MAMRDSHLKTRMLILRDGYIHQLCHSFVILRLRLHPKPISAIPSADDLLGLLDHLVHYFLHDLLVCLCAIRALCADSLQLLLFRIR